MKLPKFLNSLSFIMVPMLMLILGVWIEAGVLFNRAFLDTMEAAFRYPASALFGLAVALPILLTSIHSHILPEFFQIRGKKFGFPELFGVFSSIMVIMLFDVFADKPRHYSWFVLVGFLAVFIGLIDYLYAHLYKKKYEQEARETREANPELREARAALRESLKELKEYRQSLTCPHCGQIPETKTYSAHRNHVNRCPKNPKNQ